MFVITCSIPIWFQCSSSVRFSTTPIHWIPVLFLSKLYTSPCQVCYSSPDVCTASPIGDWLCLTVQTHCTSNRGVVHIRQHASWTFWSRRFGLEVQHLGCKTLALCCVGCWEKFRGHFMFCLELVWEKEGLGTPGGYLLCVLLAIRTLIKIQLTQGRETMYTIKTFH